MIDFHTHILPGIDDGSRDMDETIGLLREEIRQGVRTIVATPHFYANRISVEGFLHRREQSVQSLGAVLSRGEEIFDCNGKAGEGGAVVPQILTGAEVYFFPGMGRAEKLRNLCITRPAFARSGQEVTSGEGETTGRSDLILIEMPFEQWTSQTLQELRDIIVKQRLRIVLAHVERYPEFQRDMSIWNQVMSLPLTIQINGGSFLKSRGKRKFCLNMLKEHQNVILGSDCHNLTTRKPNLAEATKVIAKKLGSQRVDQIEDRISQLLQF